MLDPNGSSSASEKSSHLGYRLAKRVIPDKGGLGVLNGYRLDSGSRRYREIEIETEQVEQHGRFRTLLNDVLRVRPERPECLERGCRSAAAFQSGARPPTRLGCESWRWDGS